MPYIYQSRDPIPCEECGYFVNGKCDVPGEVYEYTCPNYNDPEPKWVPEEVSSDE